MSEVENKKVPSERSEEVLLIHCTSPTTGSPTDREVILYLRTLIKRIKHIHEQSEWISEQSERMSKAKKHLNKE
jgi:hypothetical protein